MISGYHDGKPSLPDSDIRVVQHIVDGDFVATHFEEITTKGILPIVGLFELRGDKVCFVRVFFDSAHPAA